MSSVTPTSPAAKLLRFADLGHYEWLSVPAWVFDPVRFSAPWANAAGLAFWRADSLEELRRRDFSDVSPAMLSRLQNNVAVHCEGRTTRETWTLYPRNQPVTSTLQARGIELPDGQQGILFVGEPLAASYDAGVLRGIEAMQHTTVRVMLHSLDDGAALMRNQAAAAAFGPAENAAAGGSNQNSLFALFAQRGLGRRIAALAKRGQTYSGEAELSTLSGPRWHALDARPVRDPVTGQTVVQVNARDISDPKAYQSALETARDAAEAASLAKSAFLANMSHEIRTPMNGVLGLTELVLDTELDPRQRNFLELAHGSAKSLMGIINDLLDISKIEAQRLTLDSSPFLLSQLLESTLAPRRVEAQTKGLQLDWQIAQNTPDALLGDAMRVGQILTNLVGNAIKFTHHGDVSVRASCVPFDGSNTELRLAVRDTGIGMTPDELARAYEPFVQADASTTRRYGGTGLGLSIVHRLAQMMNGHIRATSATGQGSLFEVTLRMGLQTPAGDD